MRAPPSISESSTPQIRALPPELSYNLRTRLLVGAIDGQYVSAYSAPKKLPGGGALAIGTYRVLPHETKAYCLRLFSMAGTPVANANALIQAAANGNEACIVPTDFALVRRLYDLVKRRVSMGGREVRLQVQAG
jgi:hypothetical protein